MDSNSNINKDIKFEFNLDPINNININEELENKWKEIDDLTLQKIKKNKESRQLNNLNNFAIMRINLNSLIHPTDDISEFENYCNLKIRHLDKYLNSLEMNSNYNSNINIYVSNKFDRKINNNDSNIKSFLKPDDDESDSIFNYNKFKKYTLNELIEINNTKNKKTKRKIDYNKLFEEKSNNEEIYNNKTFSYNTKNKNDKEDAYDRFENKLNEIKNTFLKKDKNITITNNNLYSTKERNKKNKFNLELQNDYNISGYNTTKNKTIDNAGIKNKIDDSYNYLYSLYPTLRKNKENK